MKTIKDFAIVLPGFDQGDTFFQVIFCPEFPVQNRQPCHFLTLEVILSLQKCFLKSFPWLVIIRSCPVWVHHLWIGLDAYMPFSKTTIKKCAAPLFPASHFDFLSQNYPVPMFSSKTKNCSQSKKLPERCLDDPSASEASISGSRKGRAYRA